MEAVVQNDFFSIDGCDTVAKLFPQNCEKRSERTAMREKKFGIWQEYSWSQYYRYSSRISAALMSIGLNRGDVVSILSDDNKEWVFADLATIMAGGITNGIYPTYQSGQITHILKDSDTKVLFVENEEQLDKFLEVRDEVPQVEKVIVIDPKGLRGFKDDMVMMIDSFYELGDQYLERNPNAINEAINDGNNDETIVLVYTSGTTGKPKGTEISNRALLFQGNSVPDPLPVKASDEILTYLPLCHVAERLFSVLWPIVHGPTINFVESPATIFQNMQELSPTIVFGVPRIWEKFYSRVRTLMSESTWIGKKAFDWGVFVGQKRAQFLTEKQSVPIHLEWMFHLADRFVFRNLKQLLGLDKARLLISGAAPISGDLLKWYYAFGLTITEVYGQTETCGMVSCVPIGEFLPGTIGKACPNVDIRLGDGNEILIKSPGAMTCYRNNPEATQSTLKDGWIYTGDVGEVDENSIIRITDRIKDIIITSGGKNITPSQIENRLKFSPYISDACVIGDQKKYLTCLIMIDQENVEHFAQTHSVPFTDYKSLCARKEIIELITEEVKEANLHFSSVEQVKKFRLIDVLLTAEDDELTPTMKLKRSFVSKKYKDLIDTMY